MIEFEKLMAAQKNAIEKSVYLESEKVNRNLRFDFDGHPSQDFFHNWVESHADKFRNAWQDSVCKRCKKVFFCYDCVRQQCNFFEE